MRRREFIGLVGGAAATPIVWPLAARAQQSEKMRRIGVLNSLARTDAVAHDWDNAFRGRLDELGLIDGRGIQLDYRWGDRSVDRMHMLAGELVRLNPDVLVAMATPATAALRAETRSVPIVFAAVSDPVGSRFVTSLARPGGDTTGFVDI